MDMSHENLPFQTNGLSTCSLGDFHGTCWLVEHVEMVMMGLSTCSSNHIPEAGCLLQDLRWKPGPPMLDIRKMVLPQVDFSDTSWGATETGSCCLDCCFSAPRGPQVPHRVLRHCAPPGAIQGKQKPWEHGEIPKFTIRVSIRKRSFMTWMIWRSPMT